LKVLVNPNWDIPNESIFPLIMLTELWGIDLSFPDVDRELATVLEVAIGTPLPATGPGDFDSPDKPLQKKRGVDRASQ
jgi:hypothetical protein